MKTFAAFVVFFGTLWGGSILAETQSVHFSAVVTQVFNQTGNGLALASRLGIAVGDTITGRYFFDSNHPDSSLDPTIGLYNNIAAPFIINLHTASTVYSFQSNANRITVRNQPTFDEIDAISLASVNSNLPTGTLLGQMNVLWNDQTASAISSEALVAPPQFPWTFKRVRLLAFDDGSGNQFGLFAELDSFIPSQSYVVINTNDSGPGSLRQAILDARSDGVPSDITFDPAVFPATINLLSRLPVLNEAGDSIEGGGIVTLKGINLTTSQDHGIRIFAGDVTVRGLTIQDFGGNGVRTQPDPNQPPGQTLTGIVIADNIINKNSDGIVILGGEADNRLGVTITNNTVTLNINEGIVVNGSVNFGDGMNQIDVRISNNFSGNNRGEESVRSGDGIIIVGGGGSNLGNNVIRAMILNNTVKDNADEGIRIAGANTGSGSSHNQIEATIVGNISRQNGAPNGGNGITVTGGPTPLVPADTTGNSITFLVMNNESHSNVGSAPAGNGLSIRGNNGTGHRVTGIVFNNLFNNNDGSGIQLLARGSLNVLHDIEITSNSANGNGLRGLSVLAGDNVNNDHPAITNLRVNGNRFTGNGRQGIDADLGDGLGNLILFAEIIGNETSRNGRDGLLVRSGINGSGATAISQNRADRNARDGIMVQSTGYFSSENRADANTAGAGISAIGNSHDGSNRGSRNQSCNTPGCF